MESAVKRAARTALSQLGLLNPLRACMRRFSRSLIGSSGSFYPATPHLPVAVAESMRYLHDRRGLIGTDYLEFGIFNGFTLWFAQAFAWQLGAKDMRFFGFDSFRGLPIMSPEELWEDFVPGAFACSRAEVEANLQEFGVDWTRMHLIEGWFGNTLAYDARQRYSVGRCALCVIDCDLYLSASQALTFLYPVLADRAILLFDDWNDYDGDPARGEQRAFREFLTMHPDLAAREYCMIGPHGKGFEITRRASPDKVGP